MLLIEIGSHILVESFFGHMRPQPDFILPVVVNVAIAVPKKYDHQSASL